jgi:uncharacterized membrane protein YedE/YeeE
MEADKQPVPAPLTGEVLPPQAAKPTPMNPLAVISMILGIASVCLSAGSALITLVCCAGFPALALGIVFGAGAAVCGHVSLSQIAKSGGRDRGRNMAIAGLVTGYAGIGVGLLVVILMVVFGGALLAGAASEPLLRSIDGPN